MKDFDLAAAKRGATVCTRQGWPVRILCFDFEGSYKPIVAAIKVKEHEELIREYSNNGRFDGYSNCYADLMMADDDYLEKLERGEYSTTTGQNQGREEISDIARAIGTAVKALANMDFSQMNKCRTMSSDHIGESAEKVHDPRSLGNEWLNDMIKARSSIFKDLERSLDIERRKYELSKLKHETEMLELERIPENWDYWRRMYAGMAMQGILPRFNPASYCVCSNESEYEFVAVKAAKYADALIEALKKENKDDTH